MRRTIRLAGIWLALQAALAGAATYTVTPPNPTTNDVVRINGASGSTPFSFNVMRDGNKLVVQESGGIFSVPGSYSLPLGVLPAGKYTLTGIGTPKEFTVTQGPTYAPEFGPLDGVWGMQDQPGRALYLGQTEGGLAGGWLLHVSGDAPVWYLLQGNWVAPREFFGALTQVNGSGIEGPFDPAAAVTYHAGVMHLSFTSAEAGRMSWDLGGFSANPPGDVIITKFKFR